MQCDWCCCSCCAWCVRATKHDIVHACNANQREPNMHDLKCSAIVWDTRDMQINLHASTNCLMVRGCGGKNAAFKVMWRGCVLWNADFCIPYIFFYAGPYQVLRSDYITTNLQILASRGRFIRQLIADLRVCASQLKSLRPSSRGL